MTASDRFAPSIATAAKVPNKSGCQGRLRRRAAACPWQPDLFGKGQWALRSNSRFWPAAGH